MDSSTFEVADAGSRIKFDFQGSDIFLKMNILLNCGNPELENQCFSYFIGSIKNWVAFVSNYTRNPSLHFLSTEHNEKLGFLEHVEI